MMNKDNSKRNSQMRNHLLAVAGAALFSITPAMMHAQMNGGAGAQQQSSPSQPTAPGSQPGMSPAEQAGQATGQGTDPTSQMMDKAFVRDALQGGMAEVELGKIALQKSNNPDVKQFAQKMVDDHTKIGDVMKQIAQKMDVKVPDSPSGKDKSNIAKMQALSGDDFDKAYIKDMVKDHEKDE